MTLPGTRIEANGIAHHVVVEGKGPAVVLLHGFPDSSYLWRNQIPALAAAGFRVIAPDLRGFGDSDKPEGVKLYSLSHHINDLQAILHELGVDERFHLVGHDWGAGLGWAIATFVPERVNRFVAMSVGRWGTHARTLEQLGRSWYMFAFLHEQAEAFLMRDDWAGLRAWASMYPDAEHAIGHLSEPGALTAALGIYRANLGAAFLLGEPVDLPKVQAPTMGIWSERDFALSEKQMTDSADDVSGGFRYERIEGAGHWLQLEAPDRINELLFDFLG